LQVHNLISKHSTSDGSLDLEKYEEETKLSITDELDKLKGKNADFDKFSDHACYCVLALPVDQSNSYDRKYSFYENGTFKPVFPLVLDAYQQYFWDEIMNYVGIKEAEILAVCHNPSATYRRLE